jgi:carbon monoxide dehydrogenase subunit G
MELTGEYRIPAPRERVWAALNDPQVLKAAIAGCQELEKVTDSEFRAIVATRVGPVSATFRGTVTLSDQDPPNGYTLIGQGQGGAAGFAKMRSRVSLAPDGDATVLTYTANAEIGGKLAAVGSRLVQSVAKKNADDFFGAFATQLGGGAVAKPAEVAAPVPVAAAPAALPLPSPAALPAAGGGLGAPVPAWLVVFGTGIGIALGYALAMLAR